MSKINEITPIADRMSIDEAETVIRIFLSEVLSSDKVIKQEDISSVETTSDECGFRVIKLKDDSTWIIGDREIERIVGTYYLDAQLQESKLNGWKQLKQNFV